MVLIVIGQLIINLLPVMSICVCVSAAQSTLGAAAHSQWLWSLFSQQSSHLYSCLISSQSGWGPFSSHISACLLFCVMGQLYI